MQGDTTADEQKEAFLAETVLSMARYGDALVEPYDVDSDDAPDRFMAALAQAFDVDPHIVAQLSNMDLLRAPSRHKTDAMPNGAQVLTGDGYAADALQQVLSFLLEPHEPHYSEPYQHSEADRRLIGTTLRDIAWKYGTAVKYFAAVSRRLWCQPHYMATRFKYYMVQMEARLPGCRRGHALVFSHIDEDSGCNKAVYSFIQ